LNDLRTASLTILANGIYEPFLEDIIFELSDESEVFYDIGANLGFYSIGVATRNSDVECFSFEPNPKIAKSLKCNVSLNQLEGSIQIFEYALSETAAEMEFFIPSLTGSGGGSFHDLHPEEGRAHSIVVRAVRLDEFSAQLREPDLMKIDVEGAELSVITGGLATIKRNHPTIVVELLRKWMKAFGVTPQNVLNLLAKEGYECFGVQRNRLAPLKEITEETIENNFLFLHPERLNHRKKMTPYIDS
jgi:FkbM family methyltransferase